MPSRQQFSKQTNQLQTEGRKLVQKYGKKFPTTTVFHVSPMNAMKASKKIIYNLSTQLLVTYEIFYTKHLTSFVVTYRHDVILVSVWSTQINMILVSVWSTQINIILVSVWSTQPNQNSHVERRLANSLILMTICV